MDWPGWDDSSSPPPIGGPRRSATLPVQYEASRHSQRARAPYTSQQRVLFQEPLLIPRVETSAPLSTRQHRNRGLPPYEEFDPFLRRPIQRPVERPDTYEGKLLESESRPISTGDADTTRTTSVLKSPSQRIRSPRWILSLRNTKPASKA